MGTRNDDAVTLQGDSSEKASRDFTLNLISQGFELHDAPAVEVNYIMC
ncbi:unnamed protein product [Brugia pahangi]|uniref:ABC transporter ATP-binding protein n=1 Tax=Brugia pahangi TaxID=6280 RepID=A0A0N4TPD3_BRUPA|nr:unnamed protein product [Brugia pahangi]